jgi:hypothetical protein
MATLYVARSAQLGKWASDVGLGKHIYKIGVTDEPVKPLVQAGWAGESDWQLVKQQPVDGASEAELLARLARKATLVEPRYYPRIRDAAGIFKVDPIHVENHMLVTRALAGGMDRAAIKLKPADFADYLIHNALRS